MKESEVWGQKPAAFHPDQSEGFPVDSPQTCDEDVFGSMCKRVNVFLSYVMMKILFFETFILRNEQTASHDVRS